MLLVLSAFATEVVVDDEDGAPAFTTTGDNWETWAIGSYGYDSGDRSYHYLTAHSGDGSRTGTATWSPELPSAGTWRIEVWFRRTENRSADADHVVTDGTGATHRVSIDQTGDGGSGWISLGEHPCNAGRGGCTVTVDGDDGASDEANAVRFTLVSDPVVAPCEAGPGAHTWTYEAGNIEGDAWSSPTSARTADGAEASIDNLDAGEDLVASGWSVCDPEGEETITAVRVSMRARTQYDSGVYAVILQLDAGGAATTYTGTDATWTTVTPNVDTWAEVSALVARVSLDDHPGGRRDSDVWVDAFALEVDFLMPEEETASEDSAAPVADTGAPPEPTSEETGDAPAEEAPAAPDDARATGGAPGALTPLDGIGCRGWAWLVLGPVGFGRRLRADRLARPGSRRSSHDGRPAPP